MLRIRSAPSAPRSPEHAPDPERPRSAPERPVKIRSAPGRAKRKFTSFYNFFEDIEKLYKLQTVRGTKI